MGEWSTRILAGFGFTFILGRLPCRLEATDELNRNASNTKGHGVDDAPWPVFLVPINQSIFGWAGF
jgi:hypothetical protein